MSNYFYYPLSLTHGHRICLCCQHAKDCSSTKIWRGFKPGNRKCMYHSPSMGNDLFVHRLANQSGLNEERVLGSH